MMRPIKFLLLYLLTHQVAAADKELTCEITDTEWEPLNGNVLMTCDILTQTIDSPGFKINPGTQENDKIMGLRFTENQNMNYFPEGIGELFPNLEGLLGVKTYLTVINANDLKGLNKLKYLNLAKSDLKVIEEGAFDDLISLTELDLSDSGIRFIHENAFRGLVALKTLYLGANKLSQLEVKIFNPLTSLESISLEFNHLEEIDDNLFASNTLLADIWLNSNKITIMDWKVFGNLKSLSYVDVQDNPCIDGVYDSSNFDDLKTLLGENCAVKVSQVIESTSNFTIREEMSIDGSVDNGSFSQYMKIVRASDGSGKVDTYTNDPLTKAVECSMTQIYWRLSEKELNTCEVDNQIIDAKDFQLSGSGNSIKAMSFDGNMHIKYLPKNIAKFSPNLVEFSAANSSLMLISDQTFAGLRHLRSLNLANSKIRFIDPDAFDDLTSLQELDLSGNELEAIDEELFTKLKNLRVLRIGSNRLHTVHPKLFRSLRNLVNISMSHQYISMVDENIFKTNGKVQNIWMNSNKLKSISPNMFNNLKSLEYVDVRDNKCIATIYDQSSFADMKNEILAKCGSGYELKMGKKSEIKGKGKKKNKKQKNKKEKLQKVKVEEEKEVVCEYEDVFWPHANRTLRTCIINEVIDDSEYFLSANPILFDTFQDTDSVEAISFVNNKNIKYLPKNIGEVFPNLIEMSAANSGITEINSKTFKGLKKLKSLNLAGNEIESLSEDVFEDLTSLEELNIDDNQLKIVTFKYLKSLRRLRMKGNKFRVISHTWLEELSELHDITFDVDELLTNWEIFRRNPKLKWISMNGKFYNSKMEEIKDPQDFVENPLGNEIIESVDEMEHEIKEIECVYDDDETCSISMDETIDSIYYAMKESPRNSQIKKFLIFNNENVKFLPRNLGNSFPILESISIQKTGLNTIKKDYFENLPHLHTLNLNHNKIKSFESDTFDDLSFLNELEMNGNLIENLEEGIFHNLRKLHKLNLGSNSLHFIHPKTFKFLKKLKEVNLNENQLSVIDETAFKLNPNLEIVELNGNKIETLSPKTFEFSRKLKRINVEGNKCVDGVFDEVTINQLKKLLSQNCEPSSKSIVKEVYCDLNSDDEILKDCIILNQPIEVEGYVISIDSDAIDGEKVETLRISNSERIKYLPGNAGEVFPNLLHFHATNNSLEGIPKNTFLTLSKLKTLDLSNNKLKEFDPETFNDLSSLEEINLSGNKIGIIDDVTFAKMPNLRKIDLSGNDITYVTSNAFSKLPNLEVVTVAEGEDEVFDDIEDEITIKIVKRKKKKIIYEYDYDEDLIEPTNATEETSFQLDCDVQQQKWSPSDDGTIQSCLIDEEIATRDYKIKSIYSDEDTKEMRIENNENVHYLPHGFRYNFPKLRRIVARNLSLEEIESDAFENLEDLTEIDFSKNKFKKINGMFKNLNNLEWIDMSDNDIEEIPTDFFWDMPSLQYINFSGNKITKLDTEMFSQSRMPKLRKLSIVGNEFDFDDVYLKLLRSNPGLEIDYIEKTVTEELKTELPINKDLSCKIINHPWSNDDPTEIVSCIIEDQEILESDHKIISTPNDIEVHELKIENNENVHFLPEKFNEKFPKLKRVIARNLSLEEVQPDSFKDLTDLVEVDLSKNKLKKLNSSLFKNLPDLEVIDFSDNEIEELPIDFFWDMPSLKYIKLNGNKITQLDPEMFSKTQLPNLKKLSIADNNLDDDVYEKILENNPDLIIDSPIINILTTEKPMDKNLSCKIEHQPWSVDDPTGILSCVIAEQAIMEKDYEIKSTSTTNYVQELKIMDDKNVHFLPEKLSESLPKLTRVIAKNLSLEEVPKDAFKNLINLTEIDLSHNSLKSLDPELFENLLNLEEVNLSHNDIEEIPKEIFNHAPLLKKIYLDHNKIRKIDPKDFENASNLRKLSLLGNDIDFEFIDDIRKKLPKLQIIHEALENPINILETTSLFFNEITTSKHINQLINLPTTTQKIHRRKKTRRTTTTTARPLNEVSCDTAYKYSPYFEDNLFTCNMAYQTIEDPEVSLKSIPNGDQIEALNLDNNLNIKYLPDRISEAFPNLKELSAKNSRIESLLPGDFENLKHLENIDLSGNSLHFIEPEIFVNLPSLKNLDLSGNEIEFIHEDAFEYLPSLKRLTLDKNSITFFDPKTFEGMPKLEVLNIEGNNIPTMSEEVFKKNPKLSDFRHSHEHFYRFTTTTLKSTTEGYEIECEYGNNYWQYSDSELLTCDLSSVVIDDPNVIIKQLPRNQRVKGLSFVDNKNMKYLPKNIGEVFPNLVELSAYNTSIKEIPKDSLKKLPRLKFLNLMISDIEKIHPEAFEDLHSLENLELSSNKITDLHPDTLKNNPYIKALQLGKNALNKIDPKLLENLHDLRNISLESNNISSINRKTFGRNYDLENVWLEGNKINSIDPTTFDGKPRLEYVDLRENDCIDEIFEGRGIDGIKKKVRKNCPFDERTLMEEKNYYQPTTTKNIFIPQIRSTTIQSRRPTTTTKAPIKEVICEHSVDKWPNIICTIFDQPIDDGSFVIKSSPRDQQVTQLVINDNKDVKFLPGNIPKIFPNLEKLSAKNNSIIEVIPGNLENLRKLKSLDLSDNDLSIIEPDVFENADSLEEVNLSGNHLTFLINETFTKTPRIKFLDFSRNEISDLNPELLKNLPDLESVSFQSNKIFDIPEKVFQRNPKLKKINLGDNELISINPEIFDNLRDLKEVNLNGNRCINGEYDVRLLSALKIDLKRKCKPVNYHEGHQWGVDFESNEIDTENQEFDKNSVECDITEEYSPIARGNVETCRIGSDKNFNTDWKIEDSPRTKRVKRFVIDDNKNVHKLPKNLAEAFPELTEMEITKTPLKEIHPESLKNLNNLKTLKLPKNSIKYLDSNTFEEVPKLQNLFINDNNLRHIDENAFKNLPHLNNLDLSNNKLPKISKEVLKPLFELKTINLANNDLNHIDFDLFKYNPKLYSIDFNGNKIKSIDPEAFDRLPALFNLDLMGNECIDRKFGTSSINPYHLKKIIGEHCQPHKSLKNELKNCQKLVESCKREMQAKPMEMRVNNDREMELLRKSEIEIRQLNLQLKLLQSELMKEKELRRSERENLNYFERELKMLRKSCARIDESHNFLVDIECDFIEGYDDYSCDAKNVLVGAENSTIENVTGSHKRGKRNADVTSLTFINQNMKFLPNELFKFFPNLRILKIDNSKLSKISPLKSLPQLTHLSINNNRIREIDPTAFKDLPQLESIDLSQNYIEKLPEKLFEDLPNLKELNLADNMLTSLPQDIIPKVNNLEKFFANNNQFDFIDPRALKKLRKAEVIDLRNGKCIDENYNRVENEGSEIVKLIGKISLNCINDDDNSDDGFCKGKL